MTGKIDWEISYGEGCEIAEGEGPRGFVEIRWDDQDPNNLGYGYWDAFDSGEVDGDTLTEAMDNYESMTSPRGSLEYTNTIPSLPPKALTN